MIYINIKINYIVRLRLDNTLNKQKIICISGKSDTGKSTLSKKLESQLDSSIHINIDEIINKSLIDLSIKNNIIDIFRNEVLNEQNEIDKKN